MIDSIARLTSRRAWFVPDFSVWGSASLGEHEFLELEKIDGTVAVHYGTAAIGQDNQEVLFAALTDHRGNALPANINSPRVFVRARSSADAFVLGHEASDRFRIAHADETESPVTVDLWIVELDH
jgi:hypothetical protein